MATIYETLAAALEAFYARNPQPEGGRTRTETHTEYVWGLPPRRLLGNMPGQITRCRSAEELRSKVKSPDSHAVPIGVLVTHVQTYHPDGSYYQSCELCHWSD